VYDRYVSLHPPKDTRSGAYSCNDNLCDFYFNHQGGWHSPSSEVILGGPASRPLLNQMPHFGSTAVTSISIIIWGQASWGTLSNVDAGIGASPKASLRHFNAS
jgi:hypothetical protein